MDAIQLPQIIIFFVILVVAWLVLRFVLRLAWKVFSIGCSLIVLLGVILIVLSLIRDY
jgi:hypothetical protein